MGVESKNTTFEDSKAMDEDFVIEEYTFWRLQRNGWRLCVASNHGSHLYLKFSWTRGGKQEHGGNFQWTMPFLVYSFIHFFCKFLLGQYVKVFSIQYCVRYISGTIVYQTDGEFCGTTLLEQSHFVK